MDIHVQACLLQVRNLKRSPGDVLGLHEHFQQVCSNLLVFKDHGCKANLNDIHLKTSVISDWFTAIQFRNLNSFPSTILWSLGIYLLEECSLKQSHDQLVSVWSMMSSSLCSVLFLRRLRMMKTLWCSPWVCGIVSAEKRHVIDVSS